MAETSATRAPGRSADSAAYRPAAPAPTTATSVVSSGSSATLAGTVSRMPGRVLLRHPSSLEHETGAHPESPRRIVAIERVLGASDWLGWEMRLSPAASRAAIEAVHPAAHVDRIEALAARGGGMIDMDTTVSSGSFQAAVHAAGGAVALVDALLGPDGPAVGASLHRPPGHHATAGRAMGFCLLNNVAIAAQRALDACGARRVLVVDWDVHHGNGTNDIFFERADVLF